MTTTAEAAAGETPAAVAEVEIAADGGTAPATAATVPPAHGITLLGGEEIVMAEGGGGDVWIRRGGTQNNGESIRYQFDSAPPQVFGPGHLYVRPQRHPAEPSACVRSGPGAGPQGGGASFSLTSKMTAFVCCANHIVQGSGAEPVGGGWQKLDGEFAVVGHRGTPCTFFTKVLTPGRHDVCCANTWGTGVVLAKR